MANNIGYEQIVVGLTATGPTAATVSGANTVCAIFYVDPESSGDVRYRADQTDPTQNTGLPLRPGRHLVVAGKGDIVNSRFVSRSGGRCIVHAMYYDQVDVIAFDMGEGAVSWEHLSAMRAALSEIKETLACLLSEMTALRLGMISADVCHEMSSQDIDEIHTDLALAG